jgi:hypothetical protein
MPLYLNDNFNQKQDNAVDIGSALLDSELEAEMFMHFMDFRSNSQPQKNKDETLIFHQGFQVTPENLIDPQLDVMDFFYNPSEPGAITPDADANVGLLDDELDVAMSKKIRSPKIV